MDGTRRFFIQQNDTSEACLANLEGIESATNLFSVYNMDVERKGELAIDGSLCPTGPVKNRTWQSIIGDKLKTNLSLDSTVVGEVVTGDSFQLQIRGDVC